MTVHWKFIAALFVLGLASSVSASIPGMTTAQVSYSGIVYDATVGPDGNTWFTDNVNDLIGRLDGDGNVTTFPLAKGTRPMYITSGADGNLWFSAVNNRIGRMSTVGFFTDFPAVGFPGKIARGPDGLVWYLDRVNSRLDRIGADGVITQLNAGNDTLVDLIAGPDGNLWLADISASALLKFSPATGQVVAKYPVGFSGYAGDRLVVGPDRNLWFTHGDAIVRMTVDGAVTSFPASPNSFPFSLTVGGDGNLWFGEYTSQRIARLVIPKNGGQATITESDPLGNGPGLIIAVPTRVKSLPKGVLPFGAGGGPLPCSFGFIVAYDKGVTNPTLNMASVFIPAPDSPCADIEAHFTNNNRGDGSASVTITITNQGPADASGIIGTFQLNTSAPLSLAQTGGGPPGSLAGGVSPGSVQASGTTCTLISGGLKVGQTIYQELEIVGFAAPSESAAGVLTAFATNPDPEPGNNFFSAYWNLSTGGRHVVNAPQTGVVVIPVVRGR